MNINHLLLIFALLAFIFAVTYDPTKGTIHKNVSFYEPKGNFKQGELPLREPDLRYGYPTRIAADVMGAIFYPEKSIKQS